MASRRFLPRRPDSLRLYPRPLRPCITTPRPRVQPAGPSARCFSFTPRACSSQPPSFGQPTHETHPHLLSRGELTPGLSSVEYALRRAQLASRLPKGAVAVIPSAYTKYRSDPVFYEFHQHSDFYYLTGFLEPDSVCVIEKTGEEGEHVFHMFVRGKDEYAEMWDGPRTGVQGVKEVFNADEAYDVGTLARNLPLILDRATSIFTDPPKAAKSVVESYFFHEVGTAPAFKGYATRPLRPLMHELRVFKTGAEATIMRKVGKISGRALTAAMSEKFETEAQLAAFLEFNFRYHGCEKSAYVPVVGGGTNALSIHYTKNNDVLRSGDLVLVDAGGQYGGYAADITRTWPVNGRFTAAQKSLYEAVLTAQRKCVSLCRESLGHSLDDIHRIASETLLLELQELGFDVDDRLLESALFRHHVGHYVGLDVHDAGLYGRTKKLRSGNVVTIEPAIYVPADDERWPKHFRGMGIRIEDTVYVGEENPIVLTVEAAKEVADIEALRDDVE